MNPFLFGVLAAVCLAILSALWVFAIRKKFELMEFLTLLSASCFAVAIFSSATRTDQPAPPVCAEVRS